MAMVNPLVTAEVVEVEEFPDMGRRYQVSGVPKAVLNDRLEILGSAPEEVVLEKVLSLNR